MLRNWDNVLDVRVLTTVLNEVLSLNAQESPVSDLTDVTTYILNEVLSLNAQESFSRPSGNRRTLESSMKS